MTAFLALFGDAWRRARDRRSVTFLLGTTLLVAVFCASLEFTRPDPREALRSQIENFSRRQRPDLRTSRQSIGLRRTPKVDARLPTAEDDLPLGLDHVAVADVEFADLDDFDRVARSLNFRAAAPLSRSAQPLTARQRMDAVADYLRDRGWETVITRARDDAGASLFVAASTEHLAELEGRWRLKMFFGAAEVPISTESPAAFVVDLQQTIAHQLAGLFGMLVLLLAFGGTLPELLQKGTCDLVLARPIGRTRLVLFLYAGTVLAVLLFTTAIFGACAVGLGTRTGHVSGAFVACALPVTCAFAAVYPVALLVGLVTRHGGFAALAALSCYGLAGVLGSAREKMLESGARVDVAWRAALDVAWWIAPKTGEIADLGELRLGRSELTAAAFERFRQGLPAALDAATAYGTTALFAAFFLGVTLLLFRRRDF